MKPIPYVPPVTEWKVSFLDESRLIASEYMGGIGRYPRIKESISSPPREAGEAAHVLKRRRPSGGIAKPDTGNSIYRPVAVSTTPSTPFYSANASNSHRLQTGAENQSGRNNVLLPSNLTQGQIQAAPDAFSGTGSKESYSPYIVKEEPKDQKHAYQASDASSIASSMVPQGVGPSSVASFQAQVGNSPGGASPGGVARQTGIGNTGLPSDAMPEGLPTPPSERTGLMRGSSAGAGFGVVGGFEDINSSSRSSNNGEREYLNSPDEVLFMQVFVEEVGVWMDSLDRDKHFSRIIPFLALKSPMMLNAFLACGVKHLTLVNGAYKDDKALFYYDTATTQLLRSLQNPDRDIIECATTAVVLNVYEIMSEKPNERMSHIAGARALIRECGWDARSEGIGAACFWLNIGMEVLSCLAFNWPTAWDPDQWGLDVEFINGSEDNNDASGSQEHDSKRPDSKTRLGGRDGNRKMHHDAGTSSSREPLPTTAASTSAIASSGDEEVWVHRIFYIVAKIANFRASVPRFQEPSPHDEQVRLQNRFSEWKQLKNLCDIWNRDCPRSMRPFSYLFPSQNPSSASLFPNIWLIKRTAVIGRLFYHTAMVLLHQVNPVEPYDSAENQNAQRHHAHQVCGIVAHTKDRGVASVAIRSLAISAFVLRDLREQDEVFSLLKKITAETGWRIGQIYTELQQVWGREIKDNWGAPVAATSSPSGILPAPADLPPVSIFANNFGLSSSSGASPSFAALAPPLKTLGTLAAPAAPTSRRPLPGSGGTAPINRAHHLRMHSTASAASNTSASAAATAASSAHSSPSIAPMPFRPPQMMNPLIHADFSLPDHPYKAFYRPPNDSTHINSQSY